MAYMTLNEYIVNPMGKSNAILSAMTRESIKAQYDQKFHNVLLRENGKIDYYLYTDSKKNEYYIHVKVPSESCRDFYYDVVFKFFADETIKDAGRNLSKYYVQFFSNDPAFVFTYANAFIKNGLFCREVISKMSKEAVEKKAVEKNPQEVNGYAKILYFGITFIKERGLLNTLKFAGARPYNQREMLSFIDHADQKIADRQEEGKKQEVNKKKIMLDAGTAKKLNRYNLSDQAKNRIVTTTKKTVGVKKTKASNSSKNIKSTKTIKKK